jgi:hypothetical protein
MFYPYEASMVSPQATGSQTIHPQTIGLHTFIQILHYQNLNLLDIAHNQINARYNMTH